jgi:hypothetical protein
MEIGLSPSRYGFEQNRHNATDVLPKNEQAREKTPPREPTKTETSFYAQTLFDEKTDKILDTLLYDRLEGEKAAVKSMLEKALRDDAGLDKKNFLEKLDQFIENKKEGLSVDPYGLVDLAKALKTLHEHDFAPIDIAV